MMAVHAHPDDEAFYTGGVFARYGVEGIRTILVTCTRGEEGRIGAPELDTDENLRRLGQLREVELECSIRALGIGTFYQLGYRDSGKRGSRANMNPVSFHKAEIEQATQKLVSAIRREHPGVLISYDEKGVYGHLDHIKAHQITVAAFHAAGDVRAFPEAGEPWQPSKLYFISTRRNLRFNVPQKMYNAPLFDRRFDSLPNYARQRAQTVVSIAPVLQRKLQALRCHRTQIHCFHRVFTLPAYALQEFVGQECFILADSLVGYPPAQEIEGDLFAGLR